MEGPVTDTLPAVSTYQQFIGGSFVDAASGETIDVENPATGQVIAKVPGSAAEDVDRAVNAAEQAYASWKETTPQDRSLILLKIADSLEADANEIGRLESQNAGKPVGAAIDEILTCVDLFRFFAGAARVPEGLAATEYLAGHTRSSGATPSAWLPASRPGTTRCTWPAGSSARRSRRATRSSSSRRSGRRSARFASPRSLPSTCRPAW